MDHQTAVCKAIQNHHTSSGQNVQKKNFKSEQSSEVHPDDHIRATKQWKTIRNSWRDKCAQCWQHFKTARNTDRH